MDYDMIVCFKIFTYFAVVITVHVIRRFFVYSVGTTSLNKLKIIQSPIFLTLEIALDGDLPFER
jgi:hypothetical protein